MYRCVFLFDEMDEEGGWKGGLRESAERGSLTTLMHVWQSCVEIPSRISIASLPSKRRIAELSLRAGLIYTSYIH